MIRDKICNVFHKSSYADYKMSDNRVYKTSD